MDGEEYNDMVRFLESNDDKHRTWPRRVKESKDKEAKRAYRKKLNTKTLPLITVFCLRRTAALQRDLIKCLFK